MIYNARWEHQMRITNKGYNYSVVVKVLISNVSIVYNIFRQRNAFQSTLIKELVCSVDKKVEKVFSYGTNSKY